MSGLQYDDVDTVAVSVYMLARNYTNYSCVESKMACSVPTEVPT